MGLFRIGREHYKYVIIEVGYTGPGATCRLAELGESDFLIIEIIGIGPNLPSDDNNCWVYFPESSCPFYRVTNFHNYSPKNTPKEETQKALMKEISVSFHEPHHDDTVVEETIEGPLDTKLLAKDHLKSIVSQWQAKFDHAYPIPNKERDRPLQTIRPWLESHRIYIINAVLADGNIRL